MVHSKFEFWLIPHKSNGVPRIATSLASWELECRSPHTSWAMAKITFNGEPIVAINLTNLARAQNGG